ncbi:hypothetical protein PG985_014665 [Apiospora marii]|uniref:2EXR domain-containing protein n=1 Tax=Apiospora marii TaxID=335849 RepID=A0ABR1R596_9PEZI
MAPPFLPGELREMIWKATLEVEAKSRVVPLHGLHAIPRKQLVSPLLSACRESRWYALQFYSLRLRVYEFPKVQFDRLACYFHYGGQRYEPIPDSFVLRQARTDAFYRLGAIVTDQRQAGTLYLNPRHETFLRGPDFTDHFLHDTYWSAGLGQQGPMTYVTARMGEAAGYEVRNLVVAEPRSEVTQTIAGSSVLYGKEVTAYHRDQANTYWSKPHFPYAKGWLHCWFPRSNTPRRLPRLISPRFLDAEDFFGHMGPTDGVEKLDVRQWSEGWTTSSIGNYRVGLVYDAEKHYQIWSGAGNTDESSLGAKEKDTAAEQTSQPT